MFSAVGYRLQMMNLDAEIRKAFFAIRTFELTFAFIPSLDFMEHGPSNIARRQFLARADYRLYLGGRSGDFDLPLRFLNRVVVL